MAHAIRGAAWGAFGGLAAVLLVNCADKDDPVLVDTDGDGVPDILETDGPTDVSPAGPAGRYPGYHWVDQDGDVIFGSEVPAVFDEDGVWWSVSWWGEPSSGSLARHYSQPGCAGTWYAYSYNPRFALTVDGTPGVWVVNDDATHLDSITIASSKNPGAACVDYGSLVESPGNWVSERDFTHYPNKRPPTVNARFPIYPVAN